MTKWISFEDFSINGIEPTSYYPLICPLLPAKLDTIIIRKCREYFTWLNQSDNPAFSPLFIYRTTCNCEI